MPTAYHTTTCTEHIQLTSHIWETKLRLPEGDRLEFQAGQFVLFDVPDVDKPEETEPRAYSIASPPSQDAELTFLIGHKEGGRAGRWITEMLKEGDQVSIKGPFGVFTLDPETTKEYVFVATGTGIVPFRSHIEWALREAKDTRPMELFFGVRCEKELFWGEDLKALEEEFPNFKLHICFSDESDSQIGHPGRVTTVLPEIITDYDSIQVYICGRPEMVKDMKDVLYAKGMSENDVRTEGYI